MEFAAFSSRDTAGRTGDRGYLFEREFTLLHSTRMPTHPVASLCNFGQTNQKSVSRYPNYGPTLRRVQGSTSRRVSQSVYCCFLCSICSRINCITLELGPTGSTRMIWLGFRYMRSGECNSLPRFTSTFKVCLVSGFTLV